MSEIERLIIEHGTELRVKLSKDGLKELEKGKKRDYEFFQFNEEDLEVFVAWAKKYAKLDDSEIEQLPPGMGRERWKEWIGTQREPEDYYGG